MHYTKILDQLGVKCPERTGGFVKCIKCKMASMLLTGVAPFGAWLYCDKCKLSGDAIRLYGLAYKIANPLDIINELQKDLKLKPINVAELALYSNFYDTYYNKVQLIWEKARKYMSPVAPPAAIGRLSELGLWTNQEVFNRGFLNWFGYLPKYELEDILQENVSGLPKYCDGALIMPFYMKPGFICGYGFIGPKDNLIYQNMLSERACGFCGLSDATLANTDEVYILPHPLQAARIQHKCCLERYDKLAVVAKGFVGELDCTAINSNAVVWMDDPDDAFLKTCIVSRGFKVLAHETPYIWKPTEKASKLWQYNIMPAIHNEISECKLQDPVDYFVSELLTRGLGKAKLTLEGIGLSEYQKNIVLSACSDAVRSDIESLLNHAVQSQPITIDKKVIFEREGKLWVRGSREAADEMVCDFLMRINHVCRNKQTGDSTIFGRIILGDREIPFQADEQDLQDNPKTVALTLIAASGCSQQPYMAESIRKKYLDIVSKFSKPEVHIVQNYVGYDEQTGRFNLPLMSIDAEQVKVGMPFVLSEARLPCQELTMTPGDTIHNVKHLFQSGIEAATYMSAMAGMLSGIYNNIEKTARTNTLLIGGKGSLAEYIFDVIRMDLNLLSFSLKGKRDMERAKDAAVEHQVPVAIDGSKSNPKLLSDWLKGQGGNSIVVAGSLYAAAMGNDRDWYFVRADSPMVGESRNLLRSEQVFPFFIQYLLTVRPHSAHAFLGNLKHLSNSLGVVNSNIECAKRLISQKGLINTDSAAMHLVNLVLEGVEGGILKTFTGESSKKGHVVLKNPMKDIVTINLSNLLTQLRFFDLPCRDWSGAVTHLESLGIRKIDIDGKVGLEFDKPVWNSFVAAFKRMKSLRKALLNTDINVI